MRHTVIGLFNTYAEADGARNALVQSGFSYHEVELRANPETASDAIADESPGVLANIERFFASLFSTSGSSLNEPLAARYTDEVRRGAVLVSVDGRNDAQTELAHTMLTRLGARDVNERIWAEPPARDDRQAAQGRREHSMLDELGIGGPAATPTAAQPPREPLRAMEEERRYERVDAPPHDTPTDDDAARSAIAADGAPGSGAILRPDLAETGRRELNAAAMRETRIREEGIASLDAQPAPPRDAFSQTSGGMAGTGFSQSVSEAAGMTQRGSTMTREGDWQSQGVPQEPAVEPEYPAAAARNMPPPASPPSQQQQMPRSTADSGPGAAIPDEFLEYEEDFRMHYDEEIGASAGTRYDEYVPAYRYGATMGRDARYQDRSWEDDVELDARHDWERAAPEGSWDRFKAAVRHGWERVTGHPHHH